MADPQLNTREDDLEVPAKRQRLDDNEEATAITAESQPLEKTMTTILPKLIKRILGYLDLESLLKVAHTCKHLQSIALEKFGDSFQNREIRLQPFETSRYSLASGIRLSPINFIQVNGLDFCYPFLRCFGRKISNLIVFYNNNSVGTQTQTDHLDRYINRYCADSLTHITFDCKKKFSNKHFAKPFKNVTEVQVIGGNLEDQFLHFVDWFPNLGHLELWFEITVDDDATAVSLPNLKYLSIKVQGFSGHFTCENATRFLRANPQLDNLRIYSDNSLTKTEFGKLLNMFNRHPSITKLKLGECLADATPAEVDRLIKEHPLLEKLDLQEITFSAESALKLMRKIDSLKEIKMNARNAFECKILLRRLGGGWRGHLCTADDDCKVSLIKH